MINSRKQQAEEICIYGLAHPDTGELRYVGKARDMRKRLQSHISESKTRRRPVNCWIAALAKSGNTPEIFEISKVSADKWEDEERHLIAYFRSVGANLLNLADGGDQPKTSKEQLIKNGVKAAKKRDPYIWRWRRFMGSSIKFGKDNGIASMVERGENAIRLVDSFTPEQLRRFSNLLRSEIS